MANKMLNLKPVKMWIDGNIFKIQKLNKNEKKSKKIREICEGQEKIDLEPLKLEIKEDNGSFLTTFRLPKLYYSKLQYLPDFSIKKVSEETKTKILLPKTGQDGEISVKCDDKSGLLEAINHIHSAVGEIRDRNIPLQFACIPCLSNNIRERFEHLKSEILSMEGEVKGLHESIFMNPLKLHITIDVYAWLDNREQEEAINALNDYKTNLKQILERTGPLKLNIAGLDVMNNNIKKVDVLYTNIKMVNETEEHNLQNIVNEISNHFYNRGLAKKYQDNVKLHMTVINTKYRTNTESPKRKRRRQSFDATKILEKFKDYSFGECDFDSVHLSCMSGIGENGFYKPLAVIQLNDNEDLKQYSFFYFPTLDLLTIFVLDK